MTRTTTARLAGFTFLFYIVVGIASLLLKGRPHVTDVLTLFTSLSAVTLGVTLYAITRDEDAELAMLAMACRFLEAIPSGDGGTGAFFFSVGSTLFAWLLLRGRMIPIPLAWLGVFASVLLVVILPLRRAGVFGPGTDWSSSTTWFVWLPMLVFEVALAVWLIVKGARHLGRA